MIYSDEDSMESCGVHVKFNIKQANNPNNHFFVKGFLPFAHLHNIL
jgi:hypothetical protein